LIIVSGLLKGHFDNRGHFFEGLYDEGPFLRNIFAEDIFTEGHFLKDQNSGTFRQGHFLKDICDGYPSILLVSEISFVVIERFSTFIFKLKKNEKE
jgi:hypothetical protein